MPPGDGQTPCYDSFMSSQPVEPCPECEGRGWVLSADGSAGSARRCSCQPAREAADRVERAGIPRRYAGSTLRSFNVDSPDAHDRLLEARELSRRYVERFLLEDGRFRSTGLLYIGPPGVGKTHLAVAVLRSLIDRYGVRGRFVDFTSLVHQIQSTFDPGSEESKRQVLDPVIDADVLVVDELGAQRPTAFVNDILYLVLNARYGRCLPTIFTTNYSLEAPRKGPIGLDSPAVAPVAEPLVSRIPARLVSRLHEMADAVELPVKDFRREVLQAQTRI